MILWTAIGGPLLSFKPWSESDIQDFLSRQSHSTFSYDAVRSTAGSPPLHYNLDRTHIRLGEGARTWELAVNAVRAWQMFNVPWMKLCWPSAPIRPGTDVAVIVRHFGFWSLNACRIVYVVEDESPERLLYGFAYGTLAQHGCRAKSGSPWNGSARTMPSGTRYEHFHVLESCSPSSGIPFAAHCNVGSPPPRTRRCSPQYQFASGRADARCSMSASRARTE